jgi:hypothetical protein
MKRGLFVIAFLAAFSFFAAAQHIPAAPNTPLDSAAVDSEGDELEEYLASSSNKQEAYLEEVLGNE